MCPDVRAVSTVRRPVEISVVLPVYKCGECVAEMHSQLVAALEPLAPSFEIVFVNDGCPANSWEAVQDAAARDDRVKAIDLSRNFGQHLFVAAKIWRHASRTGVS